MPYQYNFRNLNNQIIVQCDLTCTQCKGRTRTGNRCSRNTCIGVNYCWYHLISVKHLKIQNSNLHGKGLFAYLGKRSTPNDLVFHTGDEIIIYDGRVVNSRRIHDTYREYTAPYAVRIYGSQNMKDAACLRGIGSIANTHRNPDLRNARLVTKVTPRTLRRSVVLEATRDIYHGEEIINDYGHEYNLPEDENTSFKTRYVRRGR
jgi:hypothetical protein